MGDRNEFTIVFEGATPALASQYAGDLATALRTIDRAATVEQRRTRDDAQDFGATIALILGTASASAIAKGIASWLARHSGASIDLLKDGTVVARGLDSGDAARIAEAFAARR